MNEFIQHTINGLALGSIYALVALGYTMVFGVLQLINFAHGDIFMVGSFIGLYFIRYFIPNVEPSLLTAITVILVAMAGSALMGVLIEKFAYRPLRRAPRINILITAIGVSLFLEYGGQLVFGASPQFFPEILPRKMIDIGSDIILDSNQLTIFIVSFVLMQILSFLVFKTQFGRAMRAISHSLETANLIGINVNKVILITFIIGSSLAGAAGVLYGVAYPKIDPLLGILPGLKAFIAAVLGGIGNITGAVIGAILIGLSETYVAGYISSTYRDALAFVILILVLLIRPAGLLGSKKIEKV
ncbi:branched-chain amino acid ABC transporter permease [Peredibacter starrii]|uniref:Branched-chain amino acid ABC transporter permease n=1 Tax=Peredibacter starrii TaxID=28202 RepID=A0AAX4HK77_9BACT|nr:branched-chain amino acid ABC transporter permease [Peredibacter starrii]WPU63608.1 branched-chain amino acid ABC transporter permease [Peredibacter starrii]